MRIQPADRRLRRPVFIDLETTGLRVSDRIVSMAMVSLDWAGGTEATCRIRSLVFDPLKKSHPEALRVHGLDDWFVRHQPLFSSATPAIQAFLDGADGIVAHQAAFDAAVLARSLGPEAAAIRSIPWYCTARTARAAGWRPATLSGCAARWGLTRAAARHDAVEDALLCMGVWLGLQGWRVAALPEHDGSGDNARAVPPAPRRLPQRQNDAKRAAEAMLAPPLRPAWAGVLHLRRTDMAQEHFNASAEAGLLYRCEGGP